MTRDEFYKLQNTVKNLQKEDEKIDFLLSFIKYNFWLEENGNWVPPGEYKNQLS